MRRSQSPAAIREKPRRKFRVENSRQDYITRALLIICTVILVVTLLQEKEAPESKFNNTINPRVQPSTIKDEFLQNSTLSAHSSTTAEDTATTLGTNIPVMPKKEEEESLKPITTPKTNPSVISTKEKGSPKQARSSFPLNRAEYSKEKPIDRLGTSIFLQNGGFISRVDTRNTILCKMNATRNCFTNYVADSIDLAVAFSPLYAYKQDSQDDLCILQDYFIGMLKGVGIRTVVIEAIMPSRGQVYKRTTVGNEPWEIQVTVEDAFYYRENLLNVAAKKTLDIWEYMLWIDAHQVFENTYWWEEAIPQLEHVSAVQLADRAIYFDIYNHTTWINFFTISYAYKHNARIRDNGYFAGNGWSMRKEVYLNLGNLIDQCVAGACDYSMMLSLMESDDSWNGIAIFPFYFEQLKPLIHAARKKLGGKFATVRGSIIHIDHLHLFNYWGSQNQFKDCCIDFNTDMRRDENFTLHSTNENFKQRFFKSLY